jgi:SAM-dependent methyltransferase
MTRHARERVLGDLLTRARVVCDVGCGTGVTAAALAREGRTVYAVDLSPEMCRRARARARAKRVRVLCQDVRRLRLPEPADLVLCEFNGLNHLPARRDLGPALRAIARALRPGGHVMFDLNTSKTHEKFGGSAHWFETRDFVLVLRGGHDARRSRAWLDVEWFLPRGRLWRRERERVEEVAWTDAEVRRALRAAGFRDVVFRDGVDVRPSGATMGPGYDAYYRARRG